MNFSPSSPDHHPAPQAERVKTGEIFFELFGGPIAWLVQLSGGYALVSEACSADGGRALMPLRAASWAWLGMIGLMCAAILAASLSFLLSWAAFKRTREETAGGGHHLMETGAGRTRFLALWGVMLSAGFAIATVFTAVALVTLPLCTG